MLIFPLASLSSELTGGSKSLVLSEELLRSAMAGDKQLLEEKSREASLQALAQTMNEANLTVGFTDLQVRAIVEKSKGTAKYRAYSGIINRLTGTVSAYLGSILLTRSILDQGLAPELAQPAYKLLTEALLHRLSISEALAPGIWSVAFLDYAITRFMDRTFSSYEEYWYNVFSYAFTHVNEYKVPVQVWAEQAIDASYMREQYEKDARSQRFAPWNNPKFIELSDRFWSEADVFSAHYVQAFPHERTWPVNRSLLAEARFKESFRRKFFFGYVSDRLENHLKERLMEETRVMAAQIEQGLQEAALAFHAEMQGVGPSPDEGEEFVVARVENLGGHDAYLILSTRSEWFRGGAITAGEIQKMGLCEPTGAVSTAKFSLTPLYQTRRSTQDASVLRFLEGFPLITGGPSSMGRCTYMSGRSLTGEKVQVTNRIYVHLPRKW